MVIGAGPIIKLCPIVIARQPSGTLVLLSQFILSCSKRSGLSVVVQYWSLCDISFTHATLGPKRVPLYSS